jgi:hypothetical protein
MRHLLNYALYTNSNFNSKIKIIVLRDKSNETVIFRIAIVAFSQL